MPVARDIGWFKRELAPKFKGYERNYRSFSTGDFGSLDQVEFDSDKIGGAIDFWGLGWLGIFVLDKEKEEQLLNVLLEPHHVVETEEAIQKLLALLKA